tara:strand:- start:720 stop:920 length:201 start_codon:yes stop_codon:yes gene_type:complete
LAIKFTKGIFKKINLFLELLIYKSKIAALSSGFKIKYLLGWAAGYAIFSQLVSTVLLATLRKVALF